MVDDQPSHFESIHQLTPARLNSLLHWLSVNLLITTSAATTTAAHTLDSLALLELCLGDSADAGGIEIRLLSLNTAQTAKLTEYQF